MRAHFSLGAFIGAPACALALVVGAASAQQSVQVPNAIGVWNSNGFPIWAWYLNPSNLPGFHAYQALPAELTTYFGSQATGAQRTLMFRGFELQVTYGLFSSAPAYPIPRIDICSSLVHPTQPLRWIPGPTTYASFASVPGAIPGSLGFPTIVLGADLGPGGAVPVPAGNSGGGALMMVWRDYFFSPGGTSTLWIIGTGNEPKSGSTDATTSYSGLATPQGQYLILPNPAGSSSEYCWTWLFENSLIQPINNARLVSASGLILGGTVNPIPFTFQMDDGRGGLHPKAGDAVSYNGNSKEGNPAPASLGTTWFVPFVLRSGDLPFGTNPPQEAWNSGAFAVDNTPVWKWLDDFCSLSGACPPSGTGSVLNPANSTYGLWMGLHLPTFTNLSVLLDNLSFADIAQGPLWAGPSTLAYNSVSNPGGLLGRNLVNFAGGGYFTAVGAPLTLIAEHRSILQPQAGYTPFVALPGGMLGFGVVPPGLSGSYLGIQCWMLDTVSSKIVDVTNVAVARIQ